ncbi:MAG: hypothetical protein RLZZ244_1758 [Verrucomicrobiota bacterium]
MPSFQPKYLFLALGLTSTALAHPVEQEMANAAKHFLATLSPEQRQKASFPLEDNERKNWHFIPRQRLGLPLKEMSQEQRLLAHALLATGMSSRGYTKAATVMSLETLLAELEKGQPGKPVRDPELYFVSIFGTPQGEKPWGWRFEGHHLSLNFTCSNHGASATPSFYGSNPGEVRSGPRSGLRVLAAEEEIGRELVRSLTPEQKKVALLSEQAPKDVLNDPKREEFTKQEGLPLSAMTDAQKAIAERLVREYLGRHRPELESSEWQRIQSAGWNEVTFAWAGGTDPGMGHYYRLQGKTFALEHDNTQNDANHPHTLWRDRERDFGVDLLKEHLAKEHSK